MPFPLIAIAAKKLAAKGAEKGASKVAEKGAQKAATKAAESGAQKGTQNIAQKGMKQFSDFEKSNWKSRQKSNEGGGQEDSKYEYNSTPPKFHKGGTVKKSGLAEVKKGEVVLTEKQAHKFRVGGKVAGAHNKAHTPKTKTGKKRVAAKRS
jgi:hypothetical protein